MEIINSFFSNIKDKLTNPFFGTLILVIILHHWELWYSLFNFDSDCTLEDKTNFIKNYSEKSLTFQNLTWNVIFAIVFMFIGYLVIVATRSLVIWVEYGLMPLITGKIVNKNVVRKSEYDDVVKEREEYFDQYEEQRKNVRIFSKTIDEQTEQIKQKDENLLKQSNTISITVKELDMTKVNLENLQSKNVNLDNQIKQSNISLENIKNEIELKNKQLDKYDSLFYNSLNVPFFNSIEKFQPEILKKVEELKEENKWNIFLAVGNFFQNGGTIGSEALTIMIEKEIAFERGSHEEFTPIGKIIWNYRNLFEDYNGYNIF